MLFSRDCAYVCARSLRAHNFSCNISLIFIVVVCVLANVITLYYLCGITTAAARKAYKIYLHHMMIMDE